MSEQVFPAQTSASRRAWWPVGVVLLGLILLGGVALAGWRGYTEGRAIRQQRERQAAALHVGRADALASVGETALAQQELLDALRLAPDYPAAEERLSRLREEKPNVPVVLSVPPTPTPVPTPTPSPADLVAQAEQAGQDGDWSKAVVTLEDIRTHNPDFDTERVTDLLTRAYVSQGLQSVDQGEMDAAIERFETALRLDPTNLEAGVQRDLARQYLDAISQWDQNWSQVIDKLDQMYQKAPDYKDVTPRLALAYVIQGDRLLDNRQGCAALEAYNRALVISDQADTRAKQARARQVCAGGGYVAPAAPRLNPRIVGTQDIGGATGQILGRIVGRQGRPLGLMVVTAEVAGAIGRSATSDAQGQFSFDNLAPGAYTIDVPAGIGPTLPVKIEPGKQVVIEFVEP